MMAGVWKCRDSLIVASDSEIPIPNAIDLPRVWRMSTIVCRATFDAWNTVDDSSIASTKVDGPPPAPGARSWTVVLAPPPRLADQFSVWKFVVASVHEPRKG